MRIIGKTRDYYDSVRAFGIDPNCVYIRKREEYDIENINFDFNKLFYTKEIGPNKCFPYNTFIDRYNNDFFHKLYIIGFCGRLYPCFKLTYEYSHNYKSKIYTSYVYNISDIKNFLITHKLKRNIEIFENKGRWSEFTEDNINNIFNYLKEKEKECDELFHLERIPTFVLDVNNKNLVWNEILADYQFYRVVDTFTAFQELAGYISGVLGGQSPKMVDISNDDMIHKKGFDNMSFKKAPGKKKKK